MRARLIVNQPLPRNVVYNERETKVAMPKDFYPRPEYPRPDFQRGTIEGVDWLNLNGPWQFRFDGDKRGQDLKWHLPDGPDWREQIIVPFCWESLAAWGEAETAGN